MVKDFVPYIYENNAEMKAIINAQQIEFDVLNTRIQNAFNNNFVALTNSEGILLWENLLGITADPSIESPQFRRERILNRLISNTPFTERALQDIMNNIMGEEAWSYTLDYVNYALEILSLIPGNNWIREMRETLAKIIPANIVWTLNMYTINWGAIMSNYANWDEVYKTSKTWQELMEGV